MHEIIRLGGEGASTLTLRPPTAVIPSVVVLPYFLATTAMAISAQNQIYLLAYEQAQAALRLSLYEIAMRFTGN
jgi:hypothetical protein